MMKKKIITFAIVLALTVTLNGCGNSTAKKAIEEGKIAVASTEYEKALNLFKLAMDEGGKSEGEAKKYYDIINTYLSAKEGFENSEFDKAFELIAELEGVETSENLQNDIKALKEQIENKQNLIKLVDEEIEKINQLIAKGDFQGAEATVNNINTEELSKDLIKKIEDLKVKIKDGSNNQKEEEKKNIIDKGLSIIKKCGFKGVNFDRIVNENLSLSEINNKDLHKFVGSELASPPEFYYDAPNNKMYYINQGMWFIINENYKNVTPKDSGMYEAAEDYRNNILAQKISFTVEQATRIVRSKEQELGLLNSSVSDSAKVIHNIKLYYVSGETNTTNRTVLEFFVGSDGNLYKFSEVVNENRLVKLK